jgi:hypothetical protein
MARRRYGAGAVKRRLDGRWEGQLRLPDGRRQYVYAADQRQMVSRLQEERWRIAAGIPRKATGLTLGEYLPEWLEVCRGRLRPKTFDSYALCAHRVDLQLGRVPLVRLNPMIIQSDYARLGAGGLSPRTVFQTHAVRHRALDQAQHWGLLKSNPTELVAPPRPHQKEMTALSAAQLALLLATSRGTRWHSLWVVLGTSGLRIGEALGLKWQRRGLGVRSAPGKAGVSAAERKWAGLRCTQDAPKPAFDPPVWGCQPSLAGTTCARHRGDGLSQPERRPTRIELGYRCSEGRAITRQAATNSRPRSPSHDRDCAVRGGRSSEARPGPSRPQHRGAHPQYVQPRHVRLSKEAAKTMDAVLSPM